MYLDFVLSLQLRRVKQHYPQQTFFRRTRRTVSTGWAFQSFFLVSVFCDSHILRLFYFSGKIENLLIDFILNNSDTFFTLMASRHEHLYISVISGLGFTLFTFKNNYACPCFHNMWTFVSPLLLNIVHTIYNVRFTHPCLHIMWMYRSPWLWFQFHISCILSYLCIPMWTFMST